MSFQTPTGQAIIDIQGLGKLKGFEYSQGVKQFCGIPYAKLSKRWTRSTLNTSWPEQFHDGTKMGNDCPRPGFGNDEDGLLTPVPPSKHFPDRPKQDELSSLVMNIVMPPVSQKGRIPVMVYVHGGSLLYGGANLPIFDAVNLVSHSISIGKPIICVSFNYRVGLGGFLACEAIQHELRVDDLEGCGNFGFTDQYTAFEWVQKYITEFGGDPDHVTAVGESAGGISISNQLLAAHPPKFHQAICMSGLAMSIPPWTMDQHEDLFRATCNSFNIDPQAKDSLARLRQVDEAELAEATPAIQGVGSGTGNPCIDGWFYDKDPLSIHPAPAWLKAYMVGDVDHEGVIFHGNISNETFHSISDTMLQHVENQEELDTLLRAYSISPSQNHGDFLATFEDMAGDAIFKIPNFATIKANSRLQESGRLHYYHFGQRSRLPNVLNGTSYHAFELLFLFGNLKNQMNESERRLADDFASAWVNFVYGNAPWDASASQVKLWGPNGTHHVLERELDEPLERYRRMEEILAMGDSLTWKKWVLGVDAVVNNRRYVFTEK